MISWLRVCVHNLAQFCIDNASFEGKAANAALVDENIKINVAARQISAAITLSRNDYFRSHNR